MSSLPAGTGAAATSSTGLEMPLGFDFEIPSLDDQVRHTDQCITECRVLFASAFATTALHCNRKPRCRYALSQTCNLACACDEVMPMLQRLRVLHSWVDIAS